MSRIYYRGAYAAIACYDVMNAESWHRLQYWIKEVKMFEPDCKIYVCATKTDLLGKGSLNLKLLCLQGCMCATNYPNLETLASFLAEGAVVKMCLSTEKFRDQSSIHLFCIFFRGQQQESCRRLS